MPQSTLPRQLLLLPCLLVSLQARATVPPPANQTWTELKSKREILKQFHQEFDISRSFLNREINQTAKWSVILDVAEARWREVSASGTSRIFDGKDLFVMQEGGNEYVREKLSPKDDLPQPSPYQAHDFDWEKAVETARADCGFTKLKHQCVSLEIPLKRALIPGKGAVRKVLGGSEKAVLDTETGLILSLRLTQVIDDGLHVYQVEQEYVLKRMSYGGTPEEALYHLPPNATIEVKELPLWNAARMKKQLTGKPAQELTLKDIHGQIIRLSDFKGKTVLLDFWATWCGPCRSDGPALDKLYQKYGDSNLVIIGISVEEDRSTVENFLSKHPHAYPIALTSENEMPTAYRVGVFPTYIVIDSDGNFASATEGAAGFIDLRKHLKKAGLETD